MVFVATYCFPLAPTVNVMATVMVWIPVRDVFVIKMNRLVTRPAVGRFSKARIAVLSVSVFGLPLLERRHAALPKTDSGPPNERNLAHVYHTSVFQRTVLLIYVSIAECFQTKTFICKEYGYDVALMTSDRVGIKWTEWSRETWKGLDILPWKDADHTRRYRILMANEDQK